MTRTLLHAGSMLAVAWTADPDGAHKRQVTFGDDVIDTAPAWSPDGRHIAFLRNDIGFGVAPR